MGSSDENQNSAVTERRGRTESNRVPFRRIFNPHPSRGFLSELRNPGLWNDAIVEMVMCMFLECTLIWVIVTLNAKLYEVSLTHIGIWAGLLVVLLVEGYGPLSGAGLNPAAIFGFFIAGGISATKAVLYTVAEFVGSAFGAMIGFWLTPSHTPVHAILPGTGVTDGMALVIEAILAFNLILVALVVRDPRKPSHLASVAIGFCIGTGAMTAGTHTGGLQNPSLAFGPCVASGNFSRYWPYFVGPYLGAIVAALFWMTFNFIRYNYDHNYIQQSNVGHDRSRDVGQRPAKDDQHVDMSAV